jgi:hypothetical protein
LLLVVVLVSLRVADDAIRQNRRCEWPCTNVRNNENAKRKCNSLPTTEGANDPEWTRETTHIQPVLTKQPEDMRMTQYEATRETKQIQPVSTRKRCSNRYMDAGDTGYDGIPSYPDGRGGTMEMFGISGWDNLV